MGEKVSIRMATLSDARAILDIYAPYVLHTAITFDYEVPKLVEYEEKIAHVLEKYPFLVAEGDIEEEQEEEKKEEREEKQEKEEEKKEGEERQEKEIEKKEREEKQEKEVEKKEEIEKQEKKEEKKEKREKKEDHPGLCLCRDL